MQAFLKIFMYFMGIFWIVMGALLVFASDLIRKKFFHRMKKWNIKKTAILPLTFGILFLAASSASRFTLFIVLLGLISILKGVFLIVKTEDMKKMLKWWLDAGNGIYRVWGVMTIVMGSFILMGIVKS